MFIILLFQLEKSVFLKYFIIKTPQCKRTQERVFLLYNSTFYFFFFFAAAWKCPRRRHTVHFWTPFGFRRSILSSQLHQARSKCWWSHANIHHKFCQDLESQLTSQYRIGRLRKCQRENTISRSSLGRIRYQ